MKNKILSGIVALSIVISALPVTTKAAVKGDITKQEYIYNISGSGGEKLITTDPPAPTIEPTQTPETIDTSKPTQTPEPEPTPTPEPTQTPEPEPTPTPEPTQTPEPEPTPTPEPTQTPEPEIPAVTEKPEPTDKPFFIPGYYIDLPENIFNVKVSTEQEETGKVSGQKVVFNGDTVTVKAEAAPGYVFIEWTEDGQQVSTEAEYTFVPERNINLIAIFKKNMPENMKDDTIKVGNKVKTVETVPLPDGWEWDEKYFGKTIPAGGSAKATALYTAEDAEDYFTTFIVITISRDACKEDQTVLYTKEGEKEPGCLTEGTGHTECSLCGDIIRDGVKTPAVGHKAGTPVTKKALLNIDGSINTKCVNCNSVLSSTKINKIKTIKLKKDYAIYTKKDINIYSYIEIKDSEGNILNSESDYTVAPVGPDMGIYTVKVTFKGEKYGGTAELLKKFKVVPKAPKLLNCRTSKKKIKVNFFCTAKVTGYQIQYSTKKNFPKKSIEQTVYKRKNNSSKTSKVVKCKKSRKKYYIRVRAYKEVKNNGKKAKVYSEWSKTRSVKVK